jgi:hypothetical protein
LEGNDRLDLSFNTILSNISLLFYLTKCTLSVVIVSNVSIRNELINNISLLKITISE